LGTDAALDLVEPFVRVKAEFFAHLVPVQSRPVAEIHFAEPGRMVCVGAPFFKKRREGLLDALHRAGVNGVEFFAAQEIGQRSGLFAAARRQIHVNRPPNARW
jgi:hypothetical protein